MRILCELDTQIENVTVNCHTVYLQYYQWHSQLNQLQPMHAILIIRICDFEWNAKQMLIRFLEEKKCTERLEREK